MKSRKQLLMDFYLELLSSPNDGWRLKHQRLYATTRDVIADELGESSETIQRIFERMAQEDR